MRSWWSEKPITWTTSTSARRNRRVLRSSHSALRSRSGMSPTTAMDATGSVRPSWRMIGASARSGKSSMAPTSVRTSSITTWMSAPSSISTVTVATDSRASERTSYTFSTSSMASSIRRQMVSSTSSGVAPL